MRVYTTLVKGQERDSHFASRIDLSLIPLVKNNKEVNKKRLKAVSQVNKC